MKKDDRLIAIYDFEVFPYALGDVLTWNIRTAIKCKQLNKKAVDVYVCIDKEHPAGIYQKGLIDTDNCELFFSELYAAFATNPMLGNLFFYRKRSELIENLVEISVQDISNKEALNDYLNVIGYAENISSDKNYSLKIFNYFRKFKSLKNLYSKYMSDDAKRIAMNIIGSDEKKLNDYFIKYIHSHRAINEYAKTTGTIPFLCSGPGCEPDIEELIGKEFSGKKIVPFHLRLRRLDGGYGGEQSYERDSNFLEWYDFLVEAKRKHPDVIFIALGRLQEKPLAILKLPNVISLRNYGMGIGHELSLMLKSDLFIGTSSGFAAFANFSPIKYYITRMNPGSCHAYDIPEGVDTLPFGLPGQKLIYEKETTELLINLLEEGLERKCNQNFSSKEGL
jgi:hypothetical protein